MFYYLVLVLLQLILLFRISTSQDIKGRVNLGSALNSSISESFIFTLNVNSGSLQVYFELYNVTDGRTVDGLAIEEDVIVSCEVVTRFTEGDSVIEFDPQTTTVALRNGVTTGMFSFKILSQGRLIKLQCRGQTSPAVPQGSTSYFELDSSAGQPGFLTIKKSPTVSLCADRILVAPEIARGQVLLRLSEPVRESNVTAKCEVTGVPQDEPINWLIFEDVQIEIGKDSAAIGYRITDRGGVLRVECSAKSDDGVQFQMATSMSDVTFFDFETGSVQLVPATSMINEVRFSPLLVLSDPLRSGEMEVTFFCGINQLNTTAEAEEMIKTQECVASDDGDMTPTTANNSVDGLTTDPNGMTTFQSLETTLVPLDVQTDAPPVNSTAIWSLEESQIVFQEGDIKKSLDIRLSSGVAGYRGVLLVRCCATANLNMNIKYKGASASSVATVDVAVARAINWTQAADLTELQSETIITNPAYTEVSPCPCDLRTDHCDVNCCCDQVCTENDTTTFTCLQGIQGGDFTRQTDYSCSTPNIYHPDYSLFLCVETDNSPYLGHYFTARTGAHDAAEYNTLKVSTLDEIRTSFDDSSPRALLENVANSRGYKFGLPIETLFDSNARGFLALPEAAFLGGCSWVSPIRFQKEMTSTCIIDPQQHLCAESSSLNARAFILSTNIGYPPCPNAPGILTSYGGSKIAPTTVRYYCRDDITPYLIPSTNSSQLFPSSEESLFPETNSRSTNISLPNRCSWDDGYRLPPVPQYDAETYQCSNSVLDVRYEVFWQGTQIVQVDAAVILGPVTLTPQNVSSELDEEEALVFVTPPPTESPVTSQSVSTVNITPGLAAENTTIETLATLTSTGLTTTNMDQTTQVPTTDSLTTEGPTSQLSTTQAFTSVTTNGPTTPDSRSSAEPGTPTKFTQHFQVKFTHLSTPLPSPSPTEPPQVDPPQQIRSGKPGYVQGRKVLSGRAIFNPSVKCNDTSNCESVDPNQPGDFVRIDDTEANRLRIWVPGPGSLCSQSGLADLTFGDNQISGCILRLGWNQLNDCTTLRSMMWTELRSSVAADQIGKIGNASVTIQNNWAPVFLPLEELLTSNVPTTMETDSMATDSMETNSTATGSIATDYMTTDNINKTGPKPFNLLEGICYNVPTGINIEILYTAAGEFGAVVQHEIMAARVTFSTSTVALQCIGASGYACYQDKTTNKTEEWVQSFPITSTVVFTQVPDGRIFTGTGPAVCYNDMCDAEMLFLLSYRFYGDSIQYSLAALIFVVIIVLANCIVIKPWTY